MTELYIRKDAAYEESIQTAKGIVTERIWALETGAADDPAQEELQELPRHWRSLAATMSIPICRNQSKRADAIVERLAQLPEVAACYDQWRQLKDEIAATTGGT